MSARASASRAGGRRGGGLNDSQLCAVGPGLRSPQRWSFPPASISLGSCSLLSIQPFLLTFVFSEPVLNTTGFSFPPRPTLSRLQPGMFWGKLLFHEFVALFVSFNIFYISIIFSFVTFTGQWRVVILVTVSFFFKLHYQKSNRFFDSFILGPPCFFLFFISTPPCPSVYGRSFKHCFVKPCGVHLLLEKRASRI